MYSIDFSLIFNNIVNNIDTLQEEELMNNLSLLYKQLYLPEQIDKSSYLKKIILKCIKEIILLYEYHNIVVNNSYNYICGNNPTNLINSSYISPYNFLKLDLDTFEINKYNIIGNQSSIKQEIDVTRINFFPSQSLTNNNKIHTREKEISFKRIDLIKNELNCTITYTYYINSIVDEIHKYNYNLKNIKINDYKKLGLNELQHIVYQLIEQSHIKPNKSLIIKRCHKYPEYVEVTLDNQKFLTTINLNNGINSLLDYNKPLDKTITRIDGNPYAAFIISNHKIESKEEALSEELDEVDKDNFVKYYKYINKSL